MSIIETAVISCVAMTLYMLAGFGFYRLAKKSEFWDAHPIMILGWPAFLIATAMFKD